MYCLNISYNRILHTPKRAKMLQSHLILFEINTECYIPTDLLSLGAGWRPHKYAYGIIDCVSNSTAATENRIRCRASRTTDTYCVCRCPRGICCRTRSWEYSEVCGPRGEDWRPSWDWPRRRDLAPEPVVGSDCLCSKRYFFPFRLRPRRAWPSIKRKAKLPRRTALENLPSRYRIFLLHPLFPSLSCVRACMYVCVHADTHGVLYFRRVGILDKNLIYSMIVDSKSIL